MLYRSVSPIRGLASMATLEVAMIAVAAPAYAEAGDFLVRSRFIVVAPQGGSSGITPAFPNDGVSIDTAFAPEINVTYMVTKNIGLELIAATTKHSATGQSGTPAAVGKLLDTWVLPPTLTLQYHFAPDAGIRPYAGVGLNYTIFYRERASGSLEAALGQTEVRLSNSFGWALQAGADIPLNESLFVNFDVKYIDMDTTARLTTAAAGMQQVRVDINPVIVGFGIGMRF